jgi:hypothetical protein
MFFKGLFILITLGSGGISASGAFATCADLELVLAIDSSGSVDDGEFALQKAGYAKAFTDPTVRRALAEAGVVDVAVVLWGDEEIEPQVLTWRRVDGPGDATGLAAEITLMPRLVTGDTGIGRGLWTALDLLEARGSCAARQVVNVSGDGRESFGPRPRHHVPLVLARDRAASMGVTVNGLAITLDGPGLEDWYRDRVITGPGAFVMTADTFEAFGAAIIRKLAREIALPKLAATDIGQEVWP